MTGTIGQVFKALPSIVPEFQAPVLEQIAKFKAHHDEEMNRNICYCLGNMFEASPTSMNPFLFSAMSEIKGIFENSISNATKENALAAIAKTIIAFNVQFPIEVLLSAMVDSMPFKGIRLLI